MARERFGPILLDAQVRVRHEHVDRPRAVVLGQRELAVERVERDFRSPLELPARQRQRERAARDRLAAVPLQALVEREVLRVVRVEVDVQRVARILLARRETDELHVPVAHRPLPRRAELGRARRLLVWRDFVLQLRIVGSGGSLCEPLFEPGRLRLTGEHQLAAARGNRRLAVERIRRFLVRTAAAPVRDQVARAVAQCARDPGIVIVVIHVRAQRIIDRLVAAAPGEAAVRCGFLLVSDLGARLPASAARGTRPYDVREHGRVRCIAGHFGAPQDFDAHDVVRGDALENVLQRLALRGQPLAVDEHVADGAGEAAALVFLRRVEREAGRLADHVERGSRRKGLVEGGVVNHAVRGRERRRHLRERGSGEQQQGDYAARAVLVCLHGKDADSTTDDLPESCRFIWHPGWRYRWHKTG
jgi:hypothetical protein